MWWRRALKASNTNSCCPCRGHVLSAFLQQYFAQYVDYEFTSDTESQLDDVAGDLARLQCTHCISEHHTSLTTDEAASTMRMMMLSVGHTFCIARIAESTSTDRTECIVPQWYQCQSRCHICYG